jgi:antitoxin component of RelBE/YafQ-DinJ toxin-antitoxin module
LILDAIENVDYFNNIEKVLSSIGLSISDAVMTFFNSGGVQNKDVCIDR